jgi:hypothetical protein
LLCVGGVWAAAIFLYILYYSERYGIVANPLSSGSGYVELWGAVRLAGFGAAISFVAGWSIGAFVLHFARTASAIRAATISTSLAGVVIAGAFWFLGHP